MHSGGSTSPTTTVPGSELGSHTTPNAGVGRSTARAEGAGFEPAVRGRRTPVFKTGAFNRSASPPSRRLARIVGVPGGTYLYTGRPHGEVAEWLQALACYASRGF